MDIVKALIFGAGACVVTTLLIGVLFGASLPLLFLLPPYLGGVAASAYHAHFGRGGWPRHIIAVLSGPGLVGLYSIGAEAVSAGRLEPMALVGGMTSTLGAALLGLGTVMGVRLLLGLRDDQGAAPAGSG